MFYSSLMNEKRVNKENMKKLDGVQLVSLDWTLVTLFLELTELTTKYYLNLMFLLFSTYSQKDNFQMEFLWDKWEFKWKNFWNVLCIRFSDTGCGSRISEVLKLKSKCK